MYVVDRFCWQRLGAVQRQGEVGHDRCPPAPQVPPQRQRDERDRDPEAPQRDGAGHGKEMRLGEEA